MNSVNTAVSFASSILSLKLPGIVSDFLPETVENTTPLQTVIRMFTTVLGLVPLTGPIATGRNAVNQGLGFLLASLTPPEATDKFVQWSNVAGSLSQVGGDYQSTVSSTIDKIIQANPLDPDLGIASLLSGGNFLGVTQNFTSSDLQSGVDSALTRAAIAAAITASGTYVLNSTTRRLAATTTSPSVKRMADPMSTWF